MQFRLFNTGRYEWIHSKLVCELGYFSNGSKIYKFP
jgi:hypothetical protein